jgi:CheY-like chemotaxis protein
VVSADHSRLQQVIWNLLANAIKFTPRGGRVEARLDIEEDEAVVRISDTGEGIAPEFLPHVFDRFRQETGDITRTHSGLGIGLALVRHLTELHGGTVTAESAGKGHGATFSIRLPLVRTAPVAPRVSTGVSRADGIAELAGIHVLAVDDDADARDLLSTALRQAGARVTTAGSVADAAAAVDGEEIHVVLTDIAMPNDSGYDLLRRLRAVARTATAPVVAITAYTRPEDRERAVVAGFDAQVTKPVRPKELVELLASLARRAAD